MCHNKIGYFLGRTLDNGKCSYNEVLVIKLVGGGSEDVVPADEELAFSDPVRAASCCSLLI